jgi:DNA-binding MarR family transcriptional regulator
MPQVRRRARRGPQVDYETLAEVRYQIRRFLRNREEAARAAGIEPQQYVALLQVKGLADRGPVTIGVLAERLQLRHHSVVELVDRLADQRMVLRTPAGPDRREVAIALRPRGEAILRRLALDSVAELRTEGPALAAAIQRLIGRALARRPAGSRRGRPGQLPAR